MSAEESSEIGTYQSETHLHLSQGTLTVTPAILVE